MPSSPNNIQNYSKIYQVIQWVCFVALVIQVIVVSYVVFGRFVIHQTPKLGEEIALLAMVWTSLFSAGLAIESDSHIRMSIFDRLFGKKGLIIRDSIFLLLNLMFCIYLVIGGAKLTILTGSSIMPGSRLPVPILYISVPITSIGYIILLILKFSKEVRSWTRIQSQ